VARPLRLSGLTKAPRPLVVRPYARCVGGTVPEPVKDFSLIRSPISRKRSARVWQIGMSTGLTTRDPSLSSGNAVTDSRDMAHSKGAPDHDSRGHPLLFGQSIRITARKTASR